MCMPTLCANYLCYVRSILAVHALLLLPWHPRAAMGKAHLLLRNPEEQNPSVHIACSGTSYLVLQRSGELTFMRCLQQQHRVEGDDEAAKVAAAANRVEVKMRQQHRCASYSALLSAHNASTVS